VQHKVARYVARLIALLTLVTAGSFLTQVSSASDSVAQPGAARGGHSKPEHDLRATGAQISSGRFAVFGKVSTFKGGEIRIVRKVSGQPYRVYKSVRTDADTGKFRVPIVQQVTEQTWFAVVVPATKEYRKTLKLVLVLVGDVRVR
jgi:hypothetical protein